MPFTPDSPTSGFAPDSSTSGFTPDEATPGFTPDVGETVEAKPESGRKWVEFSAVPDEKITEIARRNEVDPEVLRSFTAAVGGIPERGMRASEYLQKMLSFADQSALMGVGTKLMKKMQDPRLESALDQLQDEAEKRKSWAEKGAEIGIGLAVPVGTVAKGASVGRAALTGAAFGAAGGFGASKAGEEAQSAAVGGAIGGVLGGALHGVLGVIERRAGARQAAEVADKFVGDPEELQLLKSKVLPEIEARKPVDDIYMGAIREGREELTPAEMEKVLELRPDISRKVEKWASEADGDVVDRIVAERKAVQSEYQSTLREFADYLTHGGRDISEGSLREVRPTEAIGKYLKHRGDILEDEMGRFAAEDEVRRYIVQSGRRMEDHSGAVQDIFRKVSDAQFPLRRIAEKAGLDTDKVHNELNQRINDFTYVKGNIRRELDDIWNLAGRDIQDMVRSGDTKLYHAVDTGDMTGLTDAERTVAERFVNFADEYRRFLNGEDTPIFGKISENVKPMSIQAAGGEGVRAYAPHVMMDTEKLQDTLTAKADDLVRAANLISGRDRYASLGEVPADVISAIREAKTPGGIEEIGSAREFLRGINVLNRSGKPENVAGGSDISKFLAETFEPGGKGISRIELASRAAMERQGDLPGFMRETNLFKLFSRYSNSMGKYTYLREPMSKLAADVRTLKSLGNSGDAVYIEKLLQDIVGIREGTFAASTRQFSVNWNRNVDKLAQGESGTVSPVMKPVVAVAKAVPGILSTLNRLVYPNIIGLSPRAVIMQLTQTPMKTVPELGNAYGWTVLLRGVFSNVLAPSGMYSRKIVKLGLVPKEFTASGSRWMREGIAASKFAEKTEMAVDKLTEIAMYMYQKMDVVNRSISTAMADVMARDIAGGSAAAMNSLSKLPKWVQREVADAAGDVTRISDAIAVHLNAATQYNYNRASMSEFGRSMGPLFSMFSKWPTATAGEIISEVQLRGVKGAVTRTAEKFVTPMILWGVGQGLVNLSTTGEVLDVPDRMEVLTGKFGIASGLPVTSVAQAFSGDLFSPPFVDVLGTTSGRILREVVSGNLLDSPGESIQQIISEPVRYFMPGSGYARFIFDDLSTVISGERPSGRNWIEKLGEGARVY